MQPLSRPEDISLQQVLWLSSNLSAPSVKMFPELRCGAMLCVTQRGLAPTVAHPLDLTSGGTLCEPLTTETRSFFDGK